MATTNTKEAKRVATAGAEAPLTTAAFINSEINKGKLDDQQILAAVRKRAPKQSIGGHYVSWYRWQMKQKGGGYRGGGRKARSQRAEASLRS
jgi:hypothetical protein